MANLTHVIRAIFGVNKANQFCQVTMDIFGRNQVCHLDQRSSSVNAILKGVRSQNMLSTA